MNDGDHLWEAILRRPHSRRLRLVWADWLEENGDPRSEFVRLQCRAVPRDPWREAELLRAHEMEWLGPMAGKVADWFFAGGVLEHVCADAAVFLAHADEWTRRPGLLGVRLIGSSGHVAGLAACRALARLPCLFLGGNGLSADDARSLAASPHLRRTRVLSLQNNRIGNDGFEALLGSPALAWLRVLDVSRCEMLPGFEVPADSPLVRLRSLDVSDNRIEGAVVGLLGLPGLRRLAARATGRAWGTLARLVAAPGMGRLRSLTFGRADGSDVEALAASPSVRGLISLRLDTASEVGGRRLEALAGSPHLHGLRRLSLLYSISDERGFAAFGRAGALPGLRDLSVSVTSELRRIPRGDEGRGIRELLAGPLVRRLRRLELTAPPLNGEMLAALDGRGTLPLRELVVQAGEGTHAALGAMSGRLRHLRTLRLHGSFQAGGLVAAACFPRLRELALGRINADDLTALAAGLPALESLVLWLPLEEPPPTCEPPASWPGLARLRDLTLRDATGWLDTLFRGDPLPALEKLALVRSSRATVALLADWPGLRRPSRIRLPMADIEPDAGERIAASPHWSDTTRVRAPQRSMAAFRRRLGPRVLEDHWPGPPRARLG